MTVGRKCWLGWARQMPSGEAERGGEQRRAAEAERLEAWRGARLRWARGRWLGQRRRRRLRRRRCRLSTFATTIYQLVAPANGVFAAQNAALAAEDGDGLHVEGLGEHVDEVELGEAVAAGDEQGEIAGERDGIAGDVHDLGRLQAVEQGADLGADAGAGRIHDDQVGALALEDGGLEEVEGGAGDGAVRGALERAGEVDRGGLGGFDGDDLLEGRGERAGEEADAGVEIPGEGAGAA